MKFGIDFLHKMPNKHEFRENRLAESHTRLSGLKLYFFFFTDLEDTRYGRFIRTAVN